MDLLADFWDLAISLVPVVLVGAGLTVALLAADWLLLKRLESTGRRRVWRQLAMVALTLIAVAMWMLTLPVSDSIRGQLLGLLGAVITAVVALSSTTLIANAMAGLMIRSVGAFRAGDFLRSGDHFGRVSELGLFHIEVQTADRDLTTLPNTYLITNPVTVVSESGTIVSAHVSLGYDESHARVTELLTQAAIDSGLEKPFVHVEELGDYSVNYRAAGFLSDVKNLLSARSRLRTAMLDSLHHAGVEIVSPAFMNQRPLARDETVLPADSGTGDSPAADAGDNAEEVMFDKADRAGRLSQLKSDREALAAEIAESQRGKGNKAEIERKKRQLQILDTLIERESDQQPS